MLYLSICAIIPLWDADSNIALRVESANGLLNEEGIDDALVFIERR